MLNKFIAKSIRDAFAHTPTSQQDLCIDLLAEFITLPTEQKIFVLKGYAGTGKTSIVSALVAALKTMNQNCVLLAPTGRAAKVLSNYSGSSAWSIHKEIYRQKSVSEFSFVLNFNKHKNTLFIVDEASMVTNQTYEGTEFGSGNVLNDLFEYVYSGTNCSLLLMGDTAQLLPIHQSYAPALDHHELSQYGMTLFTCELTEVIRQKAESGILYNATLLRELIAKEMTSTPKFQLNQIDFNRISGAELIEQLNESYNKSGIEQCKIICYSNKRANLYNNGVRNQVLLKEDEISIGDLILVTKNNYFCCQEYENLDFIANGDIAEIVRIGKRTEMYSYKFADVTMRLMDYDIEIDARILIDILHCKTPQEQSTIYNDLFEKVSEDYIDIANKRERYKKMRDDKYLNALQVKFAYAMTCHKAQGGQWDEVFIDQGFIKEEQIDKTYLQWLYTAITRGIKRVWLVNFSDYFFQ